MSRKTDELMDAVIERMQRVGWVKVVIRTKDSVSPLLTDLGREQICNLLDVLEDISPAKDPMADDEFRMLIAIISSLPASEDNPAIE